MHVALLHNSLYELYNSHIQDIQIPIDKIEGVNLCTVSERSASRIKYFNL